MDTCFEMYACLLNAYICTLYIPDKIYNILRSDFLLFGGDTEYYEGVYSIGQGLSVIIYILL